MKTATPVEAEATEAADEASLAASAETTPKRRSLQRQNSSGASVMQSHAAKIRQAARMAGGGIHWAESTGRRHSASKHGHGGDARRQRKTSTLAARYQDEISRREVSTVWSLGQPFDALKKLLADEFGHPEVSLVDAETGNGINSDPELRLMVEEWNEREGARKQDTLEASTVRPNPPRCFPRAPLFPCLPLPPPASPLPPPCLPLASPLPPPCLPLTPLVAPPSPSTSPAP